MRRRFFAHVEREIDRLRPSCRRMKLQHVAVDLEVSIVALGQRRMRVAEARWRGGNGAAARRGRPRRPSTAQAEMLARHRQPGRGALRKPAIRRCRVPRPSACGSRRGPCTRARTRCRRGPAGPRRRHRPRAGPAPRPGRGRPSRAGTSSASQSRAAAGPGAASGWRGAPRRGWKRPSRPSRRARPRRRRRSTSATRAAVGRVARQKLEGVAHLHQVIAGGVFAHDLQPALRIAHLAHGGGVVGRPSRRGACAGNQGFPGWFLS